MIDLDTGTITIAVRSITDDGIDAAYRAAQLARQKERDRQAARLRKKRQGPLLKALAAELQSILDSDGMGIGEVDVNNLAISPEETARFKSYSSSARKVN